MRAKKTTKKPAKKVVPGSALKKVVSKVKRAVKKVAQAIPIENGADKPTVTHTVVKGNSIQLEKDTKVSAGIGTFGVHVEERQAIEQNNKEYLALVENHPLMGEKTDAKIIWYAWHQIKGDNDPEFDQCVAPHRDKYISHAQAILNGSAPQVGSTQLAKFEQAVSRLKEKP